jgi:hypothetical protein
MSSWERIIDGEEKGLSAAPFQHQLSLAPRGVFAVAADRIRRSQRRQTRR